MSAFTPPKSYASFAARGVACEGEYWVGDVIWALIEPYDSFLAERGRHWSDRPDGLVVFAETHGGDAWCWDTRSNTAPSEYPIARVDVFSYDLYAPSFPGFLYRSILDALRELDDREQMDRIRGACSAAAQVADPALQQELQAVRFQMDSIGSSDAPRDYALSWTHYEQRVARIFGEAYVPH